MTVVVAQKKLPRGNCQFPRAYNHQTNKASSDTDDDAVISGVLLIASTLYQRHQMNVRKRKRNSWAHKRTIGQLQLGDRVTNCQKIEMVSI